MGPPFEIYGEWFLAHVKSPQKTHYSSPPAWPKIFMRGINFKSWEMKWCCLAWERVKLWIKACCPLWWWEISKVEKMKWVLFGLLAWERGANCESKPVAPFGAWKKGMWVGLQWWLCWCKGKGKKILNENWMEHSAAWPELVQGQARKFWMKMEWNTQCCLAWVRQQASCSSRKVWPFCSLWWWVPAVVAVLVQGQEENFEWKLNGTQCCLAWVRQSCSSSSSSRKVHAFDPFAACGGGGGGGGRLPAVAVLVQGQEENLNDLKEFEHRQCCLAWVRQSCPLMLLCYYAIMLLCCNAVVLQCCNAAMLQCCSAALHFLSWGGGRCWPHFLNHG